MTGDNNDSCGVGNQTIDGSNKLLLHSFRHCASEIAMEVNAERQSHLVNKLVSSVFVHFAREEKNMDMQKYPDLVRHQEDHIRYSCEVLGLYKAFNNGHTTLIEATTYLYDELCCHILKYDLDYARFLNASRTCC